MIITDSLATFDSIEDLTRCVELKQDVLNKFLYHQAEETPIYHYNCCVIEMLQNFLVKDTLRLRQEFLSVVEHGRLVSLSRPLWHLLNFHEWLNIHGTSQSNILLNLARSGARIWSECVTALQDIREFLASCNYKTAMDTSIVGKVCSALVRGFIEVDEEFGSDGDGEKFSSKLDAIYELRLLIDRLKYDEIRLKGRKRYLQFKSDVESQLRNNYEPAAPSAPDSGNLKRSNSISSLRNRLSRSRSVDVPLNALKDVSKGLSIVMEDEFELVSADDSKRFKLILVSDGTLYTATLYNLIVSTDHVFNLKAMVLNSDAQHMLKLTYPGSLEKTFRLDILAAKPEMSCLLFENQFLHSTGNVTLDGVNQWVYRIQQLQNQNQEAPGKPTVERKSSLKKLANFITSKIHLRSNSTVSVRKEPSCFNLSEIIKPPSFPPPPGESVFATNEAMLEERAHSSIILSGAGLVFLPKANGWAKLDGCKVSKSTLGDCCILYQTSRETEYQLVHASYKNLDGEFLKGPVYARNSALFVFETVQIVHVAGECYNVDFVNSDALRNGFGLRMRIKESLYSRSALEELFGRENLRFGEDHTCSARAILESWYRVVSSQKSDGHVETVEKEYEILRDFIK